MTRSGAFTICPAPRILEDNQVKSKKKIFNAEPLKNLLERVFLSGTMVECLMKVKGSVGHIVALDMTNTVLADVKESLPGLDDGEYGIGKLDTLVRFLNICKLEDLTYSITEKWLTLRRPGHGKFSILLLENDMVGTQTEKDPEIVKNMKQCPYKINLTGEFIEDALSYIGLVSGQLVSFHAREDGRVILENTTTEIERFEANVGQIKDLKKPFSVAVYSEQLSRIFGVLKTSEDDNIPSALFLDEDRPVIIRQDVSNVWALTNSAS